MMIFLGYLILLFAVLLVIMAIILQMKTKFLIRILNKNEQLYIKAGKPTSTYFIMSFLCFMDYKFIIFICKNKHLDTFSLEKIDDYREIRFLAIVLLIIDLSFFLFILVLLIWNEILS